MQSSEEVAVETNDHREGAEQSTEEVDVNSLADYSADDDSIRDEDYVLPSEISSDDGESSVEIPILYRKFQPRALQTTVPSIVISGCNSRNGHRNHTASPQFDELINTPDVMPMTKKTGTGKGKKRRIARPCRFCCRMQTNLHRHICQKHKDEEVVQHAIKMPEKERRKAFSNFKKLGILEFNKRQAQADVDEYCSERTNVDSSKTVMCTLCCGFYSRTFIARHRRKCGFDSASTGAALPLKLIVPMPVTDDFKEVVLANFRCDEVGTMCQTDSAIVQFGNKQFAATKGKRDKQMEVKKIVMAEMRRLASLFVEFKHQFGDTDIPRNSYEMLQRSKFPELERAIQSYTQSGTAAFKAGLKSSLNYLIKRFAKMCKGVHLINDRDEEAEEIDKFLSVFQLHYNSLFADATYALNRNRQVKLRRPESLPSDEDVNKLREYTMKRIGDMLSDPYRLWDSHSFVELRDLVVCRLTVFNARRGGEPARLMLSEWRDAEQDKWLDPKRQQSSSVTDSELRMFSDLKVTYQGGKGVNHLVPVLIPSDLVPAMQMVGSPSVRDMSDVNEANQYMFPSTQQAITHVNGWQSVHRVCIAAAIDEPAKLTATKMRHRVSTLYAAMDIPESERHFFYKHMGHSEGINQHVYQAPLAEAEIVKVGSCLMAMDGTVSSVITDDRSTATSENMELEADDGEPDSWAMIGDAESGMNVTRLETTQSVNAESVKKSQPQSASTSCNTSRQCSRSKGKPAAFDTVICIVWKNVGLLHTF